MGQQNDETERRSGRATRATLVALAVKGESVDELAGAAQAMRDQFDFLLETYFGEVNPVIMSDTFESKENVVTGG